MSRRCPRCDVEYADDVHVCPTDGSALVSASARPQGGAPAAGQVIDDRYRVVESLGQSAFGRTYLVDDIRTNRRAVLKVADTTEPAAVHRFEQEARLVGRIAHPAFVQLHEIGHLADGSPYYVQERVSGSTLERQLQVSGAAAVGDVLVLGKRLADGLAYIHAMDVIHRDIKPSNIAIPGAPAAPEWAEAKLLDFGVFGELNRSERGQRLTMTGQFYGTPRYMAPEQITAQPQSAATDVYALGLVLYELLYGDLPFRSGTSGAYDMMRRVLDEDVEFPTQPGIPRPLIEVLDRCLARDPRDRFADGDALRGALDRIQIVAEPPSAQATIRHTGAAPVPPAPASVPPSRRMRSSRPSVASDLPRRSRIVVFAVASMIVLAVGFALIRPAFRTELLGIVGGGLLIVAGLWGGAWLSQKLRRLQSSLAMDAERFLLGVETKRSLSETLAFELHELLERCKALDERVLGMTIARMIDEYDAAESSGDRQSALMNVSTLIERLKTRLSPWYVKQEQVLTLLAKGVGVIGGLITAALNMLKLVGG